jgi:hypothetical protein
MWLIIYSVLDMGTKVKEEIETHSAIYKNKMTNSGFQLVARFQMP